MTQPIEYFSAMTDQQLHEYLADMQELVDSGKLVQIFPRWSRGGNPSGMTLEAAIINTILDERNDRK